MALGIYNSTSPTDVLGDDKPFTVTFDGRVGGIQDRCIYIRNDDLGSWYEDIVLQPIGITGSTWWLIEKDTVPINEDWEGVTPDIALSLSDNIGSATLSDTSTYLPVWIRIQIPKGADIQTITSITFRLTATRHLI
jgi:hypothetical protein